VIAVRRSADRRYDRRGKREAWLTFYPQDGADSLADGFGILEFLDEERLPPGAAVPLRPRHDGEIFTYVHEGALAYEDSMGRSGIIRAGEFQRMTAARGVRHSESNASRTDSAHVFRIWLRPKEAGREPGYEQKRFTAAERRDRLCLVASPDARRGSLRIHQDVLIHSALLEPGQHVVHEIWHGRSAWIHVVQGEVTLGDIVLATGDAAGVTGERAVSLTARETASILLLDAGAQLPRLPKLTGAAIFKMLWDALVDVLGTTATATIVSRASRRALPRSPELGELAIERVDREYRYVVPRSFGQADGPLAPLRDLLDELRPLLAELTGQVVLRRLELVPQLREWARIAR
jgi:redox-sensitive bicupin YhaK (pirin superfamily)